LPGRCRVASCEVRSRYTVGELQPPLLELLLEFVRPMPFVVQKTPKLPVQVRVSAFARRVDCNRRLDRRPRVIGEHANPSVRPNPDLEALARNLALRPGSMGTGLGASNLSRLSSQLGPLFCCCSSPMRTGTFRRKVESWMDPLTGQVDRGLVSVDAGGWKVVDHDLGIAGVRSAARRENSLRVREDLTPLGGSGSCWSIEKPAFRLDRLTEGSRPA
jgi:hypothetical protein